MRKVAAACLAAMILCAACLTKEDLECWYDDMCMTIAGPTQSPAR